jgi:hypothetical protein
MGTGFLPIVWGEEQENRKNNKRSGAKSFMEG